MNSTLKKLSIRFMYFVSECSEAAKDQSVLLLNKVCSISFDLQFFYPNAITSLCSLNRIFMARFL